MQSGPDASAGRGGAAGDAVGGTTGTGGTATKCGGAPTLCGPSGAACTFATPRVPTTPNLAAGCNTFNPVLDRCGCDGKTCPAGETCVQALMGGTGSPDTYANACAVPCVAGDDCGPNSQCLPDVSGVFECRPPQCQSDADCSRDGCGHCVAALRSAHIAGQLPAPDVHVCVYEGPCTATSCAGCIFNYGYANPAVQGFHDCAD
jgi:hypothetical protein